MVDRRLSDIVALLQVERPRLEQIFGVSELAIFGSVVRGEAGSTSDIDILVDYSAPPTLFEFVRLQRHLSGLLGAPVDLVMKTALKPTIGRQILTELVPI
jgi:predicted nucleotidyltransferase